MRGLDRGTLRAAGFTAVVLTVFLTVNTSVAYGADGAGSNGGLLTPLEVTTSEGVSIKGYELGSQGGSVLAVTSQFTSMVMGGLFTMVRVLVGLSCWAVEVAYRFPLLNLLSRPAQRLSEVYEDVVVDALGLKGVLLAWAFVFGLVMVVRGKHAKGFGEIALTLVIGALAASTFVTPTFLLGKDGPILQAQSAAAEVAQKTVDAHSWGGKISSDDPCAGMSGQALQKCYGIQDAQTPSGRKVAKPIQDAVTNATVVKPFMLLEYGRILDPGKAADRKAYAVHLKWVSGGYKEKADKADAEDDPCEGIAGPGKAYCERDTDADLKDQLPALTPGDKLLDSTASSILSSDDQEFAAFLKDLKASGPVGKACAEYAQKPSWWRVAAVVMVFIAALLISALLVSASVVLLGTSAVCAGAAAAGGVTFVWGMLPGPSRTVVWKWLALFGISMSVILGVAAFIPAVGITIDVVLTDGPDLLAERLLLIDVLALVGLAFHRRVLALIVGFGQRLTLRMRYAKVGGSHMAGDSQLGAALAMSVGPGGSGGGVLAGSLSGRGATGLGMSSGNLFQNVVQGLSDGTGMPGDPGRLMADASAEASRGLAPLGAAVLGARIAAGGAFSLLVGAKPNADKLAALRKPTAGGDDPDAADGHGTGGPGGRGGGIRPGSPTKPGGEQGAQGPADRYRDDNGQIIDPDTGEVLHDQSTDRTLLSTRAHNHLVRLRAYRVAHQGGRMLYGATMGLPSTVQTARTGTSTATHDARQQLQVWGNTLRQDGRSWTGAVEQTLGSSRRLTPPARSSAVPSRPTSASSADAATPPTVSSPGSATAPAPPRAATPARALIAPRPVGRGHQSPTPPPAATDSIPSAPSPAAPPPTASTRRAPLPQSRPRAAGGMGSTAASRQQAQEMFRRIQENSRRSNPDADGASTAGGDGSS
ncbi:hypothetical protein ABT127_34725 [Streptomyces sp. NPDC001904]|uniref:hypothetical protein n=1 Tax=Streptomyces sp. NPDC001904 TaxID=3154531 RepID=UPI0033275D86